MARRIGFFAFALALAGLVANSDAAAQQTAPPNPSDQDIVVTGQRVQEAITNFVNSVSSLPRRSENQLGTWDQNQTICPGIVGVRARYAQRILDRMAQRALDVGIEFAEPGCRANILILVSPDPGGVARDLVERHPLAMGLVYDDRVLRKQPSRAAATAFENSVAAIRWWHVSHTVDVNGAPMVQGGAHGSTDASLLHRETAQKFGVAFVIVDARRLNDINLDFDALADYLVMVTLAQINPDADTSSHPTILNLFSSTDQSAPHELTDWDIAYLRGLYGATSNARNSQEQESQIAHSMGQTVTQPH